MWGCPLVQGPDTAPQSSLSGPELEAVMSKLHDLAAFLGSIAGVEVSAAQRPGPDSQALLRERQSLLVVRGLLAECLQLLGLWSLVVDHQVANLAPRLP